MSAPGDGLRKYLILPESASAFFNSDYHLNVQPTSVGSDYLYNLGGKAEEEIEIDYSQQQRQPSTLPSTHSTTDMNMSNNGVFKLDDFVSANKEQHEAEKERAKHASLSSNQAHTNENISPITPIPVSARSSKNIVLLHHKTQALALPQPLFTYRECSQNRWAAEMSFPGLVDVGELQGLKADGMFHSKNEAKEAASKRAVQVIEELEKQGRLSKSRKAMNRSVADDATAQQPKEQTRNWIGMLLEFQRANSDPEPVYTDYSVGTRFAALVSIEGHPTPFGSLSSLHASKKEARQSAARSAVESFQAQGLWPDVPSPVGGIKKKKAQASQGHEGSPDPLSSSSISYASRVATLAHTLSLPTPEWRSVAHPSNQDFHSVSCFFRNAGQHEGPIGEVRNVFGKKKAKEECARLTLEYLVRLRETRMQAGMRLVDGVRGGEGVADGVLGRAVSEDGDGEFMDAMD